MKMTVTKIIFLALTLILIPSTTAAKGPDGQTPAEETVCDGYTGQEYGLCNAYCEALDCDTENPKASENACMKLQEKYYNLTESMPPCLQVATSSCPCFGDLDVLFNGASSPSCSPDENPTMIWDSSSRTQVQAVTLSDFNACIGVNGDIQMIDFNEATTCVNMIENFCDTMP